MQFKVPQNIDMADRIVGPLTLVQFLYLLVGGIIVYTLFSVIAPVNSFLFVALGGPIALFTLALAFLKIQDQPFPRFVGAFLVFLTKPKSRQWVQAGNDTSLEIAPDTIEKKVAVQHKVLKKSELERLTQALDTGSGTINSQPRARSSVSPAIPPNHLKASRPTLDNVKRDRGPA